MQVVVDANPIISMLIKPGESIVLLLITELELVTPGLFFKEIEKNKEIIVEKSRLEKEEIEKFIEILKKNIKIVSEEKFSEQKKEAEEICPDEKDIDYFALALHLNAAIWSNEKQLKQQEKVKIYATHELMRLYDIS